MKILVVGSLTTIFLENYIDVFNEFGYEIEVLNISSQTSPKMLDGGIRVVNLNKKRSSKLSPKLILKRVLKILGLDRNRILLKYYAEFEKINRFNREKELLIREQIDHFQPDIVFFFWGTTVFAEITIIKELYPDLKLVLDINTYPTREVVELDKKADSFENDQVVFNKCDGIIYSSNAMKNYFEKHFIFKKKLKRVTFFDSFNSKFTPNKQLQKHDNPFQLIFLGNTDFANRSIDDVRVELLGILDAGFKITIQEPATGMPNHENLSIFKPFTFAQIKKGELANYITKFYGVLMLYNGKKDLRNWISVTTRFALSLNAGVPIVMKKNFFCAMEEITNENHGSILYSDIKDLKSKFSNKDYYFKELNKAKSSLSKIELNQRFFKLDDYLKNIIGEL